MIIFSFMSYELLIEKANSFAKKGDIVTFFGTP